MTHLRGQTALDIDYAFSTIFDIFMRMWYYSVNVCGRIGVSDKDVAKEMGAV